MWVACPANLMQHAYSGANGALRLLLHTLIFRFQQSASRSRPPQTSRRILRFLAPRRDHLRPPGE